MLGVILIALQNSALLPALLQGDCMDAYPLGHQYPLGHKGRAMSGTVAKRAGAYPKGINTQRASIPARYKRIFKKPNFDRH
jgi:hypothetical protein